MGTQVYQLKYDDELDRDIHEWLNSLPRGRKAEMVRNAIRYYLQNGEGNVAVLPPSRSSVADKNKGGEQPEERRKKPNLPTDGDF